MTKKLTMKVALNFLPPFLAPYLRGKKVTCLSGIWLNFAAPWCFLYYISHHSVFKTQDFWTKLKFLIKIAIFEKKFHFWTKLKFLIKISIFEKKFHFWTKCKFFKKRSIFEQYFDVSTKIGFLRTFRFLNKISIFEKKIHFWTKLKFFKKL